MKRIYLCSRVAADARPLNDTVANALKAKGFSVFIPHAAPINNGSGATDEEIFTQDIGELRRADIVVAVGRLGVDCSVEIGYAMGSQKPIYHYSPKEIDLGWHPMYHPIRSESLYHDLEEMLKDLTEATRITWGDVLIGRKRK